MIFLLVDTPEIAKQRVRKRVLSGGHNIPGSIIERRYLWGLKNLPKFLTLVDDWYLYDNSEGQASLIAKQAGDQIKVSNFEVWQKIKT